MLRLCSRYRPSALCWGIGRGKGRGTAGAWHLTQPFFLLAAQLPSPRPCCASVVGTGERAFLAGAMAEVGAEMLCRSVLGAPKQEAAGPKVPDPPLPIGRPCCSSGVAVPKERPLAACCWPCEALGRTERHRQVPGCHEKGTAIPQCENEMAYF